MSENQSAEKLPRSEEKLLQGEIEAILIVCDEGVRVDQLTDVLDAEVPEIERALADLQAKYAENANGFVLRESKDGFWQLFSAPEHAETVEKFLHNNRLQKLSIQALEVLAIIAYKQPVTRAEIASIRGVNSDQIVRALLAKELICHADELTTTGATKYATTDVFLQKLGIQQLDELYPLAPYLPPVTEIDENERLQKLRTKQTDLFVDLNLDTNSDDETQSEAV
ncbi:MAG: SMC-Scp complex subunit ScpB [Bifidobacteriaceae bacterium]|nr:SMC-Scp complex subunit ScpB [Bifidobacteriaceae bacterium]